MRLKTLKPSANNSSFVPSVIEKRRETRMSTYQIFGCLKKFRGTCAKRFAPPEPLAPPPGVWLEAKPNDCGLMPPLMFPVNRCPENAFRIGAKVQPLKMCLAATVAERVRVVNGAHHKFLSAVESRQPIFTRLVKRIERHIVRSKGLRSLTVVRSTRQRVVRLELQSGRQTTVRLQYQRMIFRKHVAANFRELREPRIRPWSSEQRRQISCAEQMDHRRR